MRRAGADGGLSIRHHLPHRLRINLTEPLSSERLELITALLERVQPNLNVRYTAHRQGLVVASPEEERVCPALVISVVEASLQASTIHGPAAPPSAMERWLGSTRQGSIKVLMALAVAGWILPVLPGTPFFLLAWWLGWRPEPTDDEQLDQASTEPQLEPSALQASG